MLITIGENSKKYMKVLGIEQYPFTEAELKSRFRLLIKQFHSDINSDKKFKNHDRLIIEAYNHLKNLVISNIDKSNNIIEAEDSDIFTLWDQCPECKGTGKEETRYHRGGLTLCSKCHGLGWQILYCKCCKGTGKYKQKSDKIVNCYRCKGTGVFKKIRCNKCLGIGLLKEKSSIEIIKCWKCEGYGKIKYEPMNPVIKKGAILK